MPNRLFVVAVIALLAAPAAWAQPTPRVNVERGAVPEWVWAPKSADNQTVLFRKTFDLPADKSAIKAGALWVTCDNEVTAFVNGKRVGRNTVWQVPITLDISSALQPGRNVLALEAKNEDSAAGLLAKVVVQVASQNQGVQLVTDESWRASEKADGETWRQADFDDAGWAKVRVIGKYGIGPWQKLPRPGVAGAGSTATPAEDIKTLPDFKIELMYSVPKEKEDSWVSMTPDHKGRLIVSGQNGPLFRVTTGKTPEDTKVEKIDLPIGGAHGLLWHNMGLYVTVNGKGIEGGNGNGLYRVTDADNDDKLDKIERLMSFEGAGEHGPHATRIGPDRKLYLIAGNFTSLPEGISPNSPHKNWAEDQLLPRNPDGGGHDPHIMAPGGWIIRMDQDGKNPEVFCAGLRNAYDFDFNVDGEILTYDSDMEWDTGTPWYRPIRVNLAVSGGEYGWRNGTGKWPEYYPDSLGAVVNTGMGSPTGVTFGYPARFPAKYQHAFFIADWSYGKIYAVHMTPDGAGYRGTFEKFVDGRPFGVTDVVINPVDGHMYITIGGRGSQSGLYRVSYTGSESTEPAREAANAAAEEARATRHKIEKFHGKQDPKAVETVWPYLDSNDRYLRYAARIALEWQPIEQWKQRALDERSPTASINALLGLVRTGAISDGQRPDKTMAFKPNPGLLGEVLQSLAQLPVSSLTEEQLLEALRTLGLSFSRLGQPDEAIAAQVVQALDPMYPSQSRFVNREVGALLAYLHAPSVVSKSMKLLQQSDTQEDQLHYALIIRGVKAGWTPELRQQYFSWINLAQQKYVGGNSFRNFMIRIREDAIATLSPEEKTALEPFLKPDQKIEGVEDKTPPRQFVRNWQMSDLQPVIDQATTGRDFEKGKLAYAAAQCAKCHRFANEGGSTGPDLTGAGNRFAPIDVLEAIILPSKVISDQYRPTEFILKNRTLVSGQVEAEDADTLTVRANPLSQETTKIKKADIDKQRPARLSLMPEGLIDTLSEEEILDMIAYVRSAGNKDDKAFAK